MGLTKDILLANGGEETAVGGNIACMIGRTVTMRVGVFVPFMSLTYRMEKKSSVFLVEWLIGCLGEW